ncbi:ClpP/crotonase [Coniochaeta ligniaria NRRL 30616]|uniref:ClpP/crotonase n=1 Tax=Coniochaeta ligniaria NRRL 30616 TaxID=1408157 RepID=A0A1J7IN86_9PEZI|nr:ClpP/crotonase [Coniochaeta ligniaria NRRL 30616]
MALPKALTTPPPPVSNVLLTFPAPHVLLITLNRPASLNAIPSRQHAELDALYRWYDSEPHLRAAVLTGSGRAFCAGADLKEWDARHNVPSSSAPESKKEESWTTAGFGGLSNRVGKKPVIAAVNGLCLGGGMEMVLNCDIVVADEEKARFGLPEVTRGVVALAGALPRVVRTVGRQRAAEMALLGRMYGAREMEGWGIVNFVVKGDVVGEAVKVAEEVAGNSPDAVVVSREGLRLGWEGVGPVLGTEMLATGMYGRIDGGENMKEGVRSFVERRKARWVDSKL